MKSLLRQLHLLSTTAKEILKNLDFLSIDEEEVRELYCPIGTSD